MRRHVLAAALIVTGAVAPWSRAHAAPDTTTFTKDVAPILNAKCVQCHDGGTQDPFAGMSYTFTATTPGTGATKPYVIPYLDLSTKPITVRGVEVTPRDLVAAVLPNPAELGDRMKGRTCAGTLVTGVGADGNRALSRVEAEQLRRARRQQLDHPVE